uniref:Uncharacterized protein n=2 Tax=unclassified bacterial viruses TaxID=12333 RepID=A0AAU6VZ13_9VIRU
MLNVTSLTHPTMIAKIRQGLKCAALGKGHEMGGHDHRVYVANSKGHNIMRINWIGGGKFVAYGGAGWGRTDITDIVKEALRRANVKTTDTPFIPDNIGPRGGVTQKHIKNFLACVLGVACMLGNPSELAQYMPNPQAMHQACANAPQMLICEKMLEKV